MKKQFAKSLWAVAGLALLLMSSAQAFAQTRTISGKVVDEQGLPVIGASVMLENDTSTGTVTDMDGQYSLPFTPRGGANRGLASPVSVM